MSPDHGELWNPRNHWSTERRIEEMDALGVDIQLISPTIDFYQYHRPGIEGAHIAAATNDEIAEMVRTHPNRLMGLGTLPMQSVDLANAEMTRSVGELGLRGFEIGDHIDGRTYDDEVFEPFWALAEGLRVFLLVHQYLDTCVLIRTGDPIGSGATPGRYMLGNTVGNPVERVLSFAALVYGGVMDRHPTLTICLAHIGGYTSFAVDRMDKAWMSLPQFRGRASAPPSAYLRRFYYDSCTYNPRLLRFLMDTVGSDRVMLGTDWPAPMMVEEPLQLIESVPAITQEEKNNILFGNARRVFGE